MIRYLIEKWKKYKKNRVNRVKRGVVVVNWKVMSKKIGCKVTSYDELFAALKERRDKK